MDDGFAALRASARALLDAAANPDSVTESVASEDDDVSDDDVSEESYDGSYYSYSVETDDVVRPPDVGEEVDLRQSLMAVTQRLLERSDDLEYEFDTCSSAGGEADLKADDTVEPAVTPEIVEPDQMVFFADPTAVATPPPPAATSPPPPVTTTTPGAAQALATAAGARSAKSVARAAMEAAARRVRERKAAERPAHMTELDAAISASAEKRMRLERVSQAAAVAAAAATTTSSSAAVRTAIDASTYHSPVLRRIQTGPFPKPDLGNHAHRRKPKVDPRVAQKRALARIRERKQREAEKARRAKEAEKAKWAARDARIAHFAAAQQSKQRGPSPPNPPPRPKPRVARTAKPRARSARIPPPTTTEEEHTHFLRALPDASDLDMTELSSPSKTLSPPHSRSMSASPPPPPRRVVRRGVTELPDVPDVLDIPPPTTFFAPLSDDVPPSPIPHFAETRHGAPRAPPPRSPPRSPRAPLYTDYTEDYNESSSVFEELNPYDSMDAHADHPELTMDDTLLLDSIDEYLAGGLY